MLYLALIPFLHTVASYFFDMYTYISPLAQKSSMAPPYLPLPTLQDKPKVPSSGIKTLHNLAPSTT